MLLVLHRVLPYHYNGITVVVTQQPQYTIQSNFNSIAIKKQNIHILIIFFAYKICQLQKQWISSMWENEMTHKMLFNLTLKTKLGSLAIRYNKKHQLKLNSYLPTHLIRCTPSLLQLTLTLSIGKLPTFSSTQLCTSNSTDTTTTPLTLILDEAHQQTQNFELNLMLQARLRLRHYIRRGVFRPAVI